MVNADILGQVIQIVFVLAVITKIYMNHKPKVMKQTLIIEFKEGESIGSAKVAECFQAGWIYEDSGCNDGKVSWTLIKAS